MSRNHSLTQKGPRPNHGGPNRAYRRSAGMVGRRPARPEVTKAELRYARALRIARAAYTWDYDRWVESVLVATRIRRTLLTGPGVTVLGVWLTREEVEPRSLVGNETVEVVR